MIFQVDSSDWSNGIRYHIFDARPDTEFKSAFRFIAHADARTGEWSMFRFRFIINSTTSVETWL